MPKIHINGLPKYDNSEHKVSYYRSSSKYCKQNKTSRLESLQESRHKLMEIKEIKLGFRVNLINLPGDPEKTSVLGNTL